MFLYKGQIKICLTHQIKLQFSLKSYRCGRYNKRIQTFCALLLFAQMYKSNGISWSFFQGFYQLHIEKFDKMCINILFLVRRKSSNFSKAVATKKV